jgi:hypothetical protein
MPSTAAPRSIARDSRVSRVFEPNIAEILRRVDDDALVLDVGGWAKPFVRADWVIDLMPYETRGRFGRDGSGPERFSERTWIRRDLCDRAPFPFDDDQFDFVVCSHTLEDIRDPIWVCGEIDRVGRAGYLEVPSRLEEQSYGFQGPWVGWGHHRWLVDMSDGRVDFVFKHDVVHREGDHLPAGFQERLRPEERVQWMWWDGSFEFRERIFMEAEDLDRYLQSFVAEHGRRR